ncbi:MAG: hypothetical protein K8H88_18930, partial [Sandaracinaceae bacterium]|nr:hypothetical protein [Sandaracinaceae bacterium]
MGALDAISMEAREVLLEALMSVAWADRNLAEEERNAARAAAMGLGLVLPGDRDVTSPDRRPTPPEELPTEKLITRDRELIYLCAAAYPKSRPVHPLVVCRQARRDRADEE